MDIDLKSKEITMEMKKAIKIFVFVGVGIFGLVLGFKVPYDILMDAVIALMIFNIIFLMRR